MLSHNIDLNPAQNKQNLRQQLINARQSLPSHLCQQKSEAICHCLSEWEPIHAAQVILAFISLRQEPDLSYLWQVFPHKTWGLPRCQGKELAWYQVNPLNLFQETEVGAYGISEPLTDLPPVDLAKVDIVLVPSVACDRRGYRLGYGGGFYDRFLARQDIPATIQTVGITFAEFHLESVPTEAWDIPLHAICTEAGIQKIPVGTILPKSP
jgi:5-formyltetrahydrofolate cyclo-ligase